MSAWAPLVPYAKERLVADDAALGVLLLCLGAGSIITMPFAGALAARFGCRRVIWGANLCVCGALPALATVGSNPALAVALFAFGAGLGAADVAMNIHAVVVEKAGGWAMMSGFHGFFSVGGIIGAGSVSVLLWIGASPVIAALSVDLAITALLLAFGHGLLGAGGEADSFRFALPRGVVLFIGCLCFICFLAEGAMLDWSAVFLKSLRHMNPAHAGWGYAAFSVAMTIGRLSGDRAVQSVGRRTVIVFGGISAASGLVVAVLVPTWIAALAGFGMVGLGASNIVPVLYSALGRQRVMPANLAVGAVTTVGYLGILAGPALIGFIAHAASLATAFLCVAAMLLLVAASAGTGLE